MNLDPFHPGVAALEISLILLLSVGLGFAVAYARFRRPLKQLNRAIEELRQELARCEQNQ